jgi:hypothetical protein
MFDSADNIAHQAMQKCCICREIVEIELHVRFYSNTLIRRSNFALSDAGFYDSACQKRSPKALWRTPIDAFEEHGKLRWRQRHRSARLRHARPEKISRGRCAW